MKRGKRITDCIAGAMAAVFLVSACMVDSDTWVPTVICAVAAMYLGVYTYVRNKQEDRKWNE